MKNKLMKVLMVLSVTILFLFLGALTIRIAPGIGKLIGMLGTLATIFIAYIEIKKLTKKPEASANEDKTPQTKENE